MFGLRRIRFDEWAQPYRVYCYMLSWWLSRSLDETDIMNECLYMKFVVDVTRRKYSLS